MGMRIMNVAASRLEVQQISWKCQVDQPGLKASLSKAQFEVEYNPGGCSVSTRVEGHSSHQNPGLEL